MSKYILRALPELVEARMITEETAGQIRDYYASKPNPAANRLFIVFGILGALLVGMGIVLILAHNWDVLSKPAKLTIGLLPLLTGQSLAAYLLFKKSTSQGWKEATACFLFFGVGISIAIVSQVYNMGGTLGSFLFFWMALALPIVYVLRSSMASMLYICGITWYACETGYFSYPHDHALRYWILLLLTLPFYYFEFIRTERKNNFFYFHNWLLTLSLTICLGLFADHTEELMVVAYVSLFSIFVMLSTIKAFNTDRILTNAFLITGSLGIIGLLLALSFQFYWEELPGYLPKEILTTPEFIVTVLLSAIAGVLLTIILKSNRFGEVNIKAFAFLLFILLFILGMSSPVLAQIAVNVVILVFAVSTILSGARQNHLGVLNYGLAIVTALIICRFTDTDFSFVVRGLLFIVVGAGFFAANYFMVKKRKGGL
ncbi:MAG TPA: DUF2157 domain-containing protein [Chryseolinea sp.]|nr:DUF2157 domain-containing protein [Chryseolinea sp.]